MVKFANGVRGMNMEQRSAGAKYLTILFGVLLLLGLYLSSLYNYLLFHSLAELFSIVITFGIFVIAWNSRRIADNDCLLFIGIAYLFIGGLDTLHTLGYSGMSIFPEYDTNLPTQLWIVARYSQSLSLLLAPLFLRRRLRVNLTIIICALIFFLSAISIFHWQIFPACFVEGIGLTPFKKISEYIISAILLISIPLFYRERSKFDASVLRLLIASIIVTIFSELMFTLYIHAYGLPNLIGHFLKIVSFYLIYLAIIKTVLVKPYNLLFRELRKSEDLLRMERDRAQKYLDDAGVMFLVLDTDQKITLINEKGCEILGCVQKDIIGKNWFESFVPEKIRDEAKATFRELMSGNVESVEYYENSVLTVNGDEKIIAWHNAVLRDQEGKIIGTLSSGDDITEHIEEQARRQVEQEFERQRILGMRSDRLRSLGEMAAGIAHELNQPLQGVRGLAEHLMISIDRGWELTEEKIRERANLVVQQADRMTHIIDHIRVFARESGKPETRSVQVNNVIKSSIGLLGAQFRSRGLQLESHLEEDLPMISANPFSLEEVIINLLINARDATEENLNSGSQTNPRVILDTFLKEVDSKKYVKIRVADNGVGIPEDILDKVFDPFFTTKGPDKGTGLGLSISKSIIEQFGGTIDIQSTDGEGTTVIISLLAIA